MKKPSSLEKMPDGRLYSRTMRRCVALLKDTGSESSFLLGDRAAEVVSAELPDFMHDDGTGKMVSVGDETIRSYLSLLAELDLLKRSKGRYSLSFDKPKDDGHWVQMVADKALARLARMCKKQPSQVNDYLDKIRRRFHRRMEVPSVTATVDEASYTGTPQTFRRCLDLYCDGARSTLEIRRFPHLAPKDWSE